MKDRWIKIRTTPADARAWKRAARSQTLDLSTWLRELAKNAIRAYAELAKKADPRSLAVVKVHGETVRVVAPSLVKARARAALHHPHRITGEKPRERLELEAMPARDARAVRRAQQAAWVRTKRAKLRGGVKRGRGRVATSKAARS